MDENEDEIDRNLTNVGSTDGLEKKIVEWCWKVLKRHFSPDHVFFEDGDRFLKLASRYLPLEEKRDEIELESKTEFPCGQARCSQTFDSLIKYEAHYNLAHRHVCGTCHRILPSAHLLEIHVLESHDAMFSLLAKRIKMYQCMIEGCEEKFKDAKERHHHLIKYHHYPSNYRYRHSDNSKSKKSKSNTPRTGTTNGEAANGEAMDTAPVLVSNQQSVKLAESKFKPRVPANICFGQGVGRGFQRPRGKSKKHWHNQKPANKNTAVDIEKVDMNEMSDVLNDI